MRRCAVEWIASYIRHRRTLDLEFCHRRISNLPSDADKVCNQCRNSHRGGGPLFPGSDDAGTPTCSRLVGHLTKRPQEFMLRPAERFSLEKLVRTVSHLDTEEMA